MFTMIARTTVQYDTVSGLEQCENAGLMKVMSRASKHGALSRFLYSSSLATGTDEGIVINFTARCIIRSKSSKVDFYLSIRN
jgi:hypothetical protein